jgi:predicted acylesterase/phospholipase RssA
MTPETSNQTTNATNAPYRILSLDGGGAKGFYTIGILEEIEAMTKEPIHKSFDLIFGTSTGSIIAALLARGEKVATVRALYEKHVCYQYRRYTRYISASDNEYVPGIIFPTPSGEIINYPKKHSSKLTEQHQATSNMLAKESR